MGTEMYLVRDDNRTLFELGKTRTGLHVPLQELQDQRSGTFVVGDEDISTLGEFLLTGILDEGYWEPGDYRNFAGQLAWRINRWAGGQPIRVVSEHDELTYRTKDSYVTTDSRYEHEWLYYDVFRNLDRTIQEQIDTHMPPPSTFPAVLNVRKYRVHEFDRLKNAMVSKANPDWKKGDPVMVKVSHRELQEKFLDEMQELEPYTQQVCGFWGCPDSGLHDHGPRDTSPKEIRFCGCQCHDGVPIFCSCWVPCCHENGTPRAQQTPRPSPKPMKPVEVADFKTFSFPLIRPKGKG
jgi:hypothetical protein